MRHERLSVLLVLFLHGRGYRITNHNRKNIKQHIGEAMTRQEKLDFVHNFALTLAEEGEAFFTSGDVEQDYNLIKNTVDNQGYWAGTKYRYFFNSEYQLTHLEARRFGK